MFGNTMFIRTKSKKKNKCCQVFATNFGWSHAHPLRQGGKVHEALLLTFKCDGVPPEMILNGLKEQVKGNCKLLYMLISYGVPPEMILDGLKEQAKGNFKPKLKEINCHSHTPSLILPGSRPWRVVFASSVARL
jgi:hypothetical protein